MPPATPWCASVSMLRPVARVRSARHAPGLNMRRANSPSGRRSSTRLSRPRGNGRKPPRSQPNTPGEPGLRARIRRPSGGVAYANIATLVKPKRSCSTSSLPRHSTWCGSRHGWKGRLGPPHGARPLRPSRHRRLRERSSSVSALTSFVPLDGYGPAAELGGRDLACLDGAWGGAPTHGTWTDTRSV